MYFLGYNFLIFHRMSEFFKFHGNNNDHLKKLHLLTGSKYFFTVQIENIFTAQNQQK